MSHSDLTIADFWGLMMSDIDDDKGLGMVIINTDKGREVFGTLDMEVSRSTLETAKRFNGGFKESIKEHSNRKLFYKKLSKGISVESAVNMVLHVSVCKRVCNKIKRIIKKFI